ncbi:DUF4440 domain-containing protein [Bacillus anthracis]|uniref:hypothetical protein n=1 Tax=Bacillus TaxID=1386 RepID=UPI00041D5F6F|nr:MULTISPECIES: hypothetical protein [Bacillus cereus group]OTY48829.1 DUF4440 domain-containing protein [Bacillus thuringiensis serovar graciosensis]PFC82107.1 DUF4440 domain-containing protein [Bacillus anthracis]PFT17025.1 DUF4440 domain-containing protein [Bacillus thuringiensis]AXY10033.1 DUF4440 domain-containing protein [Bacillus thuringiensis LM1212]KXY72323.1 hypothetical protein AT270_23110 [Bacillus cereus]
MMNEALYAIEEYRNELNTGNIEKINNWVSDDFIGYFGYYNDRDYEVYRGETYKEDNIETLKSYEGQNPYWNYKDLTHSLRKENELVLSSIVDFYLHDKKVASVLAMEVFKKEIDGWKLYRQHMERYAE